MDRKTTRNDFLGDTQESAILFNQSHGKPQAIKWRYGDGKKEASLTVSPADGTLEFDGNGIKLNGGAVHLDGISGSDVQAQNLRGIAVPVPPGRTVFTVTFPQPEADGQYAVFVETNWLTARAVARQTAEGFTVQFERAASGWRQPAGFPHAGTLGREIRQITFGENS